MKKILLVALAVAGLATACRKDDDEVTCPVPVGPPSLESLTKRFAPPVQVFTLDPTQRQTLHSTGGATISLAANGFVRPDGTAPTGPVQLRFQEIYDPASMMLADMPTQTVRGELLESGGEFCIKAYEGATQLRSRIQVGNLTSPVSPRISLARRDSMTLWTWAAGRSPRTDSTGWQEVTYAIIACGFTINAMGDTAWITSSITLGVPAPITQGQYNISLFPDTIGWLNCDAYLPTPTSATVYVALAASVPEQRVYLIPHDLNGAFRPYYDPAQQRFQQGNLPTGTDLSAVVIQVKDGKYYFGTQRAAATDGFVYHPTLEEVTEEELIRRIRLL